MPCLQVLPWLPWLQPVGAVLPGGTAWRFGDGGSRPIAPPFTGLRVHGIDLTGYRDSLAAVVMRTDNHKGIPALEMSRRAWCLLQDRIRAVAQLARRRRSVRRTPSLRRDRPSLCRSMKSGSTCGRTGGTGVKCGCRSRTPEVPLELDPFEAWRRSAPGHVPGTTGATCSPIVSRSSGGTSGNQA